MTQELIDQVTAVMQKLSEAKYPAIFITDDGEKAHVLKNCNAKSTSMLFINHVLASEEMQETFLTEMEKLSERSDLEGTEY